MTVLQCRHIWFEITYRTTNEPTRVGPHPNPILIGKKDLMNFCGCWVGFLVFQPSWLCPQCRNQRMSGPYASIVPSMKPGGNGSKGLFWWRSRISERFVTRLKAKMAMENHHFNSRYIFKWLVFSIVMLVFSGADGPENYWKNTEHKAPLINMVADRHPHLGIKVL